MSIELRPERFVSVREANENLDCALTSIRISSRQPNVFEVHAVEQRLHVQLQNFVAVDFLKGFHTALLQHKELVVGNQRAGTPFNGRHRSWLNPVAAVNVLEVTSNHGEERAPAYHRTSDLNAHDTGERVGFYNGNVLFELEDDAAPPARLFHAES